MLGCCLLEEQPSARGEIKAMRSKKPLIFASSTPPMRVLRCWLPVCDDDQAMLVTSFDWIYVGSSAAKILGPSPITRLGGEQGEALEAWFR